MMYLRTQWCCSEISSRSIGEEGCFSYCGLRRRTAAAASISDVGVRPDLLPSAEGILFTGDGRCRRRRSSFGSDGWLYSKRLGHWRRISYNMRLFYMRRNGRSRRLFYTSGICCILRLGNNRLGKSLATPGNKMLPHYLLAVDCRTMHAIVTYSTCQPCPGTLMHKT